MYLPRIVQKFVGFLCKTELEIVIQFHEKYVISLMFISLEKGSAKIFFLEIFRLPVFFLGLSKKIMLTLYFLIGWKRKIDSFAKSHCDVTTTSLASMIIEIFLNY